MISSELTTWHCISLLFFLFIFIFFLVYISTLLSLLMLNIHFFQVWSSEGVPSVILPESAECPNAVGMNVGSPSLQKPWSLLLFHALGMLCQTLNAASSVAFVATAWAQMWFSCNLIVAPCVKRAWPVHRQPVSVAPACYISIAWWGTRQCQTVSPCCFFFFFFCLSRKEKKVWENGKRCLLFLENCWMLFTITTIFKIVSRIGGKN